MPKVSITMIDLRAQKMFFQNEASARLELRGIVNPQLGPCNPQSWVRPATSHGKLQSVTQYADSEGPNKRQCEAEAGGDYLLAG